MRNVLVVLALALAAVAAAVALLCEPSWDRASVALTAAAVAAQVWAPRVVSSPGRDSNAEPSA